MGEHSQLCGWVDERVKEDMGLDAYLTKLADFIEAYLADTLGAAGTDARMEDAEDMGSLIACIRSAAALQPDSTADPARKCQVRLLPFLAAIRTVGSKSLTVFHWLLSGDAGPLGCAGRGGRSHVSAPQRGRRNLCMQGPALDSCEGQSTAPISTSPFGRDQLNCEDCEPGCVPNYQRHCAG